MEHKQPEMQVVLLVSNTNVPYSSVYPSFSRIGFLPVTQSKGEQPTRALLYFTLAYKYTGWSQSRHTTLEHPAYLNLHQAPNDTNPCPKPLSPNLPSLPIHHLCKSILPQQTVRLCPLLLAVRSVRILMPLLGLHPPQSNSKRRKKRMKLLFQMIIATTSIRHHQHHHLHRHRHHHHRKIQARKLPGDQVQ